LILNRWEVQEVLIARPEAFLPSNLRKNYLLYQNKPCTDEIADYCAQCLPIRIERTGRKIGTSQWDDSLDFIIMIKKK
jgi:hypothetical protein